MSIELQDTSSISQSIFPHVIETKKGGREIQIRFVSFSNIGSLTVISVYYLKITNILEKKTYLFMI